MQIVDMHEAEIQLSKLVEKAVAGEPFIIAKAGKPLVKVVPYDLPDHANLLGCMRGEANMDKDVHIKDIAPDAILAMFEGRE